MMTDNTLPRKIWVIMDGEFGTLHGVFSSFKNAESVLAMHSRVWGGADIEEVTLDPGVAELQQRLYVYEGVFKNHNFDELKLTITSNIEPRPPRHYYYSSHYECWARDHAKAKKIFTELHTQWLEERSRGLV